MKCNSVHNKEKEKDLKNQILRNVLLVFPLQLIKFISTETRLT